MAEIVGSKLPSRLYNEVQHHLSASVVAADAITLRSTSDVLTRLIDDVVDHTIKNTTIAGLEPNNVTSYIQQINISEAAKDQNRDLHVDDDNALTFAICNLPFYNPGTVSISCDPLQLYGIDSDEILRKKFLSPGYRLAYSRKFYNAGPVVQAPVKKSLLIGPYDDHFAPPLPHGTARLFVSVSDDKVY